MNRCSATTIGRRQIASDFPSDRNIWWTKTTIITGCTARPDDEFGFNNIVLIRMCLDSVKCPLKTFVLRRTAANHVNNIPIIAVDSVNWIECFMDIVKFGAVSIEMYGCNMVTIVGEK